MRVVHVYYSLNLGGIETLLINVCNWQIKNKIEVSLVLIHDLYDRSLVNSLDKNVKLIFLKRGVGSKNPYFIFKLNKFLLLNSHDVIHVHAAEIGNLLLNRFRKKMILHIHATIEITNNKIPKAKKYIAISNSVAKVLNEVYNISDVEVVYNGINFNQFVKKQTSRRTNKIISLGNLNDKIKNQSFLIKEFHKIIDQIDANLYLVGDGKDRNKLHDLINSLNISNRVFLLGFKSQNWIKENLHKYDLFIQASLYEGLGISAIEASAANLPLLLSNVDGHKEISENGKLFELFDVKNQNTLSNKIISVYSNYDHFFSEASKNYNIYEKKFGFENFNENFMSIYNSMN